MSLIPMDDDTEGLLSFRDFPMVHTTAGSGSVDRVAQLNEIRTEHSIPVSSSSQDPGPSDGNKTYSFLSFEFYQQFFNVDTFMVLDRIASSMIPKRAGPNYLKSQIAEAPDLYGPIWIVITLVFSIAISGNIAHYLQEAGTTTTHWHYNFHLVSLAATVIIIYVCGASAGLWALFKWSLKEVDPNFETDTSSYTPSLLSLLCVYGYSLAIYIPVSVLWMIPFSFLQWLLVITAATLSGSALVFVLRPAIRNSRLSLILIIGVVAAHFLLASSFMLYFFHVPVRPGALPSVPVAKIVEAVVTALPGIKVNTSAGAAIVG